jgi:alkylation response protein AidB-like acyl-CoA dehydrogenase
VARKVGNKYILNGSKMFCTFANKANIIFVVALTDPSAKPIHKGISAFIVEKEPGDKFAPPHLTGSRIPTVGYHGMNTYALFFDNLEVPEENLVGGVEGKGFYQLMYGYEVARIQFTFRCVGLARAAFERALQYSQQRVQFGQTISKFQAMRFRLAEMATDIEAARQLAYNAAKMHCEGKRCDLEAGMAKLFGAEMALKHTWGALQMFGGYGYTMEYPMQRFWRDAGLLPVGEGTTEIQKEIIARRLLGD